MEIINSVSKAPKPVGAYSQAVKSGGFVFCAGQIGLDPHTGELVSNDIEEQTNQVLRNLTAILENAGTNFNRVVMTTIFLSDIADGKVVNNLYAETVNPEAPPARQTVAVKELPMGALLEISVIAEIG